LEKDKALEVALLQIEKQFGKGSVMKLGQDVKYEIATIPTGSLALDAALGIGGVPRGRVVEIFGPESSGKTTVALHIIAEAQNKGGLKAVMPLLLMLNMPSTHSMPPTWALISMNCWFPSRIQGSRLLKLQKPWCAVVQSMF